MRVLLETHAFLWWVNDAPALSKKTRTAIANPDNECLLSLAQFVELGQLPPARVIENAYPKAPARCRRSLSCRGLLKLVGFD